MNKFEYSLMTFDIGRQAYLKGIVKKLRMLSDLQPNKKILEIGCGNGVGSKLILEIFKPFEFIATDLDKRLIEIAKQKNNGSKAKFEVGNAVNLRFPAKEFDAVIGLSVIHHIPNWKECIDELHRIIKPSGFLIIKELSIETFETPFGRLVRRIVSHPYDSMFREDEIIKYIVDNGFDIIKYEPHNIPIFLDDFFLIAKRKKRM